MKAIIEALELLLNGLITWCRAAAAPVHSVRAILSVKESDRTAHLIAVWLWSVMLTVVLQAPVFRFFGIEMTDIGFLLPYILLISIGMLLTAVFVHLAFGLFGLTSNLFDTLSMFVMTVVVYSPISTLLQLPTQVNFMITIRRIKQLDLSFYDAIQRFFDELASRGSQGGPLVDVEFVIMPVGVIFYFCSAGIFAECVVQQYRNPRFRTLLALELGTTLALLPIVALFPLSGLLMWGSVK
jgi:hypothetical protein